MPAVTVKHPRWEDLGEAAEKARKDLGLSQAEVAALLKLRVREYAALESGFISMEIADALATVNLDAVDTAFGWIRGTALTLVGDQPAPAAREASPTGDKSTYPAAAWARLGKAVERARMAQGMTRPALAYAMKSSNKTILRLEQGRIYGDPRTAPPGDYNSEKYMLRRLAFLEMALEWEMGEAARILQGENRASVSPTA
ncbi:hypothetical protein ACPCSE_29895 [Streptomyces cellulosae]